MRRLERAHKHRTSETQWGRWQYVGRRKDDNVAEFLRQCLTGNCRATEVTDEPPDTAVENEPDRG